MFEIAIAILERSGRTQFWLVMLALFPLGILLLGVWIIPVEGVPQYAIGRLVFRYEYAAIVVAIGCLGQAIRSYRKDWKRFG